MGVVKDLTGQRFGRLLVLERVENSPHNYGRWECICDCGVAHTAIGANMLGGRTKSCGCYQVDRMTTHGMAKTRQYKIWEDMKGRCERPSHRSYVYNGGQGISFDKSWEDFENFWRDMECGYKDTLVLDRKDASLGYSKGNCLWAPGPVKRRKKKTKEGSEGRFQGVRATKGGRYVAHIGVGGTLKHLGTFSTPEEAARAYDNRCEYLGCGRPNGTERE